MERSLVQRTPRVLPSVASCLLLGTLLLGFPLPASATPILWSPNDGGNGNFYESVAANDITWDGARVAAESMSMLGVSGHLVTITSAEENAFILANVLGAGNVRQEAWLGGIQIDDPSLAPDEGWEWVTGEPWSFENWNEGEPNDDKDRNVERWAAAWLADSISLPGGADRRGTWNDDRSNSSLIIGYLVEFPTAIPEPSTALLLAIGVGLAGALRRATSEHS